MVSKAYIIQIIGFTVYLLWFMVIAWLYGFNSVIVEYYPFLASYVAQTTYTYCGAGVISLSIIGVSRPFCSSLPSRGSSVSLSLSHGH